MVLQDFLKSARFKVLAFLMALVLFFMLRAAYSNTGLPLLAKISGMALTPVQGGVTRVYESISETFSDFINAPQISNENEQLKLEKAELLNQLVELEQYKIENVQLKQFLDIKERSPDYVIEPAVVIGRSNAERFFSFTIDKGSADGIKINDPVITHEGLVGVIVEVEPTFSKVLTILDSTIEVGVMDAQTREIGITEGSIVRSQEGTLKMLYLPRDSVAKAGDIIVTTGVGGVFPPDIIVGTLTEVQADGQGLSLYGVIQPVADLRAVQSVMVIKDFDTTLKGE